MADIGKILVCYSMRGREKHELVTKNTRLLEMSETPGLKFKVCFSCSKISEDDVESLLKSIKASQEEKEQDSEREAARAVFDELKAKYGFE